MYFLTCSVLQYTQSSFHLSTVPMSFPVCLCQFTLLRFMLSPVVHILTRALGMLVFFVLLISSSSSLCTVVYHCGFNFYFSRTSNAELLWAFGHWGVCLLLLHIFCAMSVNSFLLSCSSFIYSEPKSSIKYVFSKFFLPVWFAFSFFNNVSYEQKIFISSSPVKLCFSLMIHGLCFLNKYLRILKLQKFSCVFSSRSFIVFCF